MKWLQFSTKLRRGRENCKNGPSSDNDSRKSITRTSYFFAWCWINVLGIRIHFLIDFTILSCHMVTNQQIDVFGVRFLKFLNFGQFCGSGYPPPIDFFYNFLLKNLLHPSNFFLEKKRGANLISNKNVTEKHSRTHTHSTCKG